MIKFLFPRILLLLLAGIGQAADLTSVGSWTEILTTRDLATGAGSDLLDQRESVPSITILTITNASGAWKLRARRNASPNDNLALFVRRIPAGSGSAAISGAESYVEITGNETEILSGSGEHAVIGLQYKLTGLAHNVAAANHSSSIIFTLQ